MLSGVRKWLYWFGNLVLIGDVLIISYVLVGVVWK